MDIAIINNSGESEVHLRASDFIDRWLWDMGKADRLSAYFDLIFRADNNVTFTTNIKALPRWWKVSTPTKRKLLKMLMTHGLIDYGNAA